jgi:hypothetical protein
MITVRRNWTNRTPTPPNALTSQVAAPPAYGAAFAISGSIPLAAVFAQSAAAWCPKNGRPVSQCGGGGS